MTPREQVVQILTKISTSPMPDREELKTILLRTLPIGQQDYTSFCNALMDWASEHSTEPKAMLNIPCSHCHQALTEPGAIVLSPPTKMLPDLVYKRHLCVACYETRERLMREHWRVRELEGTLRTMQLAYCRYACGSTHTVVCYEAQHVLTSPSEPQHE